MKIFLIDVDGVVLKKHEYFSARLARELDIPLEQVLPFFIQEFPLCSLGKADLKELIAPHLPEWGWQGTLDELLNHWFEVENETDEAVLTAVAAWRAAGHPCYLATDQEKYRAAHIRQSIGEQFDGSFFSCDLGLKKTDPAFFQTIADTLKTDLSDILYLDDDAKNVAVATDLGITAQLFESAADLDLIAQAL